MLTVSIHRATLLNERRKIAGAMFADKMKLMASVRLWTLFWLILRFLRCFFLHFALCPTSTTKQKLNFTFDSVTYFLFLVRGLVSYQDEGKCQDGGSASEGPPWGLPG